MADRVFLIGSELCHVSAYFGEKENRIVTEASAALSFLGDEAFASGLEEDRLICTQSPILSFVSFKGQQFSRNGECDAAAKSRGALIFRDFRKQRENALHFFVKWKVFPAKAFGVKPGRAVESVDFKSGIIGKTRKTGEKGGGFAFDRGVFEVSLASFFGLGGTGKVGQTQDVDVWKEAGENRNHLAAFFEVVSGDDETVHKTNCRLWLVDCGLKP